MNKKKKTLIKEYEITKRNIQDFSLINLLQFYFKAVTEKELELQNILPIRILCNIEELEEYLVNLSETVQN